MEIQFPHHLIFSLLGLLQILSRTTQLPPLAHYPFDMGIYCQDDEHLHHVYLKRRRVAISIQTTILTASHAPTSSPFLSTREPVIFPDTRVSLWLAVETESSWSSILFRCLTNHLCDPNLRQAVYGDLESHEHRSTCCDRERRVMYCSNICILQEVKASIARRGLPICNLIYVVNTDRSVFSLKVFNYYTLKKGVYFHIDILSVAVTD